MKGKPTLTVRDGSKVYGIRKDGEYDMRFKLSKKLASKKTSKGIKTGDQLYTRKKAKRRSGGITGCLTVIFVLLMPAMVWGLDYIRTPFSVSGTNVFGYTTVNRVAHAAEPVEKTPLSLEDKIRAKNWPDEIMIAIAKWESGGWSCTLKPGAFNPSNFDGSTDTGLFQVNSIHGHSVENLLDADYNIEAAYEVYKRQGLSAWVGYNTNMHEVCL